MVKRDPINGLIFFYTHPVFEDSIRFGCSFSFSLYSLCKRWDRYNNGTSYIEDPFRAGHFIYIIFIYIVIIYYRMESAASVFLSWRSLHFHSLSSASSSILYLQLTLIASEWTETDWEWKKKSWTKPKLILMHYWIMKSCKRWVIWYWYP